MLEHPYMTAIGARTGFPVVDLDTLNTCVVTSYNGAGVVPQQPATYQLLQSTGPHDEILVKNAMRCASAAPWYFAPGEMACHGAFMDGGLSSNNPTPLALQEAHRLAPGFKRPDHVVSIGTGCSTAGPGQKAEAGTTFQFGNRSLYQTAQHYWEENFDGNKKHLQICEVLRAAAYEDSDHHGSWFHRYNLPVEGQLPDLADADAIDGLAELARSHFETDPSVQELASSLIASLFYFELRCLPLYEEATYKCYGRIRCRISVADTAFNRLMQTLQGARARFIVCGKTLPVLRSKFPVQSRRHTAAIKRPRPVAYKCFTVSHPVVYQLAKARLARNSIKPPSDAGKSQTSSTQYTTTIKTYSAFNT
ncbi:hypothetical protein HBH98_242720 [Parastagonospora nodorum]|nr:hypothetical protein HBH53_248140 [Parastagonospora nodorum]KAH3956405.1 hypothetical protein HBH51_242290 [Parastagonospora nodorum]KAH4215564.1 hypothetical protein HBI06_246940 [Parastagonospora nodorum]KAH4223709.1 hypothetical protein HBI05_242860 [Parastagonospora nodorum]KAH4334321.1 hypothetical protein HBH98_242720 [Parastagonospora nodorum]